MGIHHVGVELEGMWNTRPEGFTYDGSVRGFTRTTGREAIGEVPTPGEGLPPTEVDGWLDANYPDQVNSTCGMHVHVSVDTKAEYSQLMSHAARLERDLIENVRQWGTEREIIQGHSLWARLDGGNIFCRLGTEHVNTQVRARRKINARYRMLNFCYTLHGTVEIRLLPGFKKKHLGIEAVNVVINTVKNALATYPAMPTELIRETSVGVIECHAWKQGFTCFLDTSARIKGEIYRKLYGRQKDQSILARLLKRDRVTIPVMTESDLDEQLTRAALTLNRFQVTLTDTRDTERGV